MEPRGGNGVRKRLPPWLLPALGYSISIACLIWVYHGFDWKSELPKLAATDWRWVSVAISFDILVYVCQGWRWNILLRPLARFPVFRAIQAVYIGLFANEVLPLRSGEVIRCYLLRRWSGLPLSVVLTSALVERILDGIWLILGFYVAGLFVALPRLLVEGSKVLLVVLLILCALLVLAIFYKGHAHEVASRSRWKDLLWHIVEGTHAMGRSRTFIVAAFLSLLYLLLQVMPIYALMRGYGIDLPFWAACVVMVVLRLGSIPPQAPGNVGSFQFLTIVGLRLFGIDRSEATGFATLLFVVVTGPLWLGGFIALLATRMRLNQIHRDAHEQIEESRDHA